MTATQIFVTVLVAIIPPSISGWIAYALALKKIKLDHEDKQKDEIIQLIEDAEDLSISYWLTKGQDPLSENLIKSRFERIQRRTSGYLERKLQATEITTSLNKLRDEVTGGLFESKDRNPENGRVSHIRDYSSELQGLIETQLKKPDKGKP